MYHMIKKSHKIKIAMVITKLLRHKEMQKPKLEIQKISVMIEVTQLSVQQLNKQ